MLTVEQVAAGLKDRRPRMVAEATGLSEFTVMKIRDGRSIDPSYKTIRVLSNYLEGKPIED